MTYKKSLRDITITGFDWVPTDFAETERKFLITGFEKHMILNSRALMTYFSPAMKFKFQKGNKRKI